MAKARIRESQDYATFLPRELLTEIEEVFTLLKSLHHESIAIVDRSHVQDSSAQLQDVLQSTEEATSTIIDSVTSIQGIVDQSLAVAQDKQEVSALISKVYEACNFQDITGQRIKKVLGSLGEIEMRITKLAQQARNYGAESEKTTPQAEDSEASLMNGPQLNREAPRQEDIDQLFKSS